MKTNFNLRLRLLVGVIFLGSLSATFQNCSQVEFSGAPAELSAFANPNAPGTVATINHFQPALAVRDISCLACHANIQANVVTDFGYGNSWFMNQNGSQTGYGDNHYLPTTWQSIAEIQGQVIVPTGTVPDSSVKAATPTDITAPMSVSISNYLTMSSTIDFNAGWTYSYWGRPEPKNLALTTFVSPPSGKSAVTSQAYVYIGAPTSQEILGLVSNSNPAPWLQQIDPTMMAVSGLSIVSGTSGSFITNSGKVDCSGKDVVVNGTLLLNNLQIFAESGGCRLYVNGSVFIVGPITYLNKTNTVDPTNNLQITSSVSIIMGVGLDGEVVNGANGHQSSTPLNTRLLGDIRGNMVLRSAPGNDTYKTFATTIMNEGSNIGTTLLVDASALGTLPTARSAAGQTRSKVDYQHLLLNAPLIHSRYLGTVTGVIVAESAEFSLGEFSFNYDPVFQSVPVLPALPKDILCAVDSASSCNPAQL